MAHEWYKVVLAEGEHFDVSNHQHLIMFLMENGTLHSVGYAVIVTLHKKNKKIYFSAWKKVNRSNSYNFFRTEVNGP